MASFLSKNIVIKFFVDFLFTRSNEEAKFVLLKVLGDIFAQITKVFIENDEEEKPQIQAYLKTLTQKKILPICLRLVPEKNPVGVYAIKLLRFILEYVPELCEYVLSSKLFNTLLGYFESKI